MIASKLLAILLLVKTGTLEELIPPTDNEVTPWLRVVAGKPPAVKNRVLRLNGSEWVEVPKAHIANALAGGHLAVVDREPGWAIIDQQGQERARLPCLSWLSGDARRLYCVTTPPTRENAERRSLTMRIWSHEGGPLGQRTASLPPADRPGFLCNGEVTMIGMLWSGEPAIEQVCLPLSKEKHAPSMNRLFALRDDRLVLIAHAIEYSDPPGSPILLWRARLPKGLELREGGWQIRD